MGQIANLPYFRQVGNLPHDTSVLSATETNYDSNDRVASITSSCSSLSWKPRLRKVANMRVLSLETSATIRLTPQCLGHFQAVVGQQAAQAVAVPAVDDDHGVFGRLVVGVGHQPADADQLPLPVLLDLGHDAHLAVVVDEAVAGGHLVGRLLEQVAEAEPQRLGRATAQQLVPHRLVFGLDRPQR